MWLVVAGNPMRDLEALMHLPELRDLGVGAKQAPHREETHASLVSSEVLLTIYDQGHRPNIFGKPPSEQSMTP